MAKKKPSTQETLKLYNLCLEQMGTEYVTERVTMPLPQAQLAHKRYRFRLVATGDSPILTGWLRSVSMNWKSPCCLDNSYYEIVIGANILYQSKLTANKNLIPYDTILPFGLTKYHDCWLDIYLYKDSSKDLKDPTATIDLEVTKAKNGLDLDLFSRTLYVPWGCYLDHTGLCLHPNFLMYTAGLCGIQYNLNYEPL